MKFFSVIVMGLMLVSSLNAQSLDRLRLAYHDATESEENANSFYDQVKQVNKSSNPVLLAYRGAGETLLARYMRLTARKGQISEGIAWIEEAVEKEPQNIEIRLIRLSVQEHLPRFLGYHQQIEEDRKFIENQLSNVKDEGLKKMINGYFEKFAKN